uniref:Sidekick cell adhesion molecule 2 n=1 Tax=Sinocyclocheilus grahami TaxID=75366 RepID=A0A672M0W1_SINGR
HFHKLICCSIIILFLVNPPCFIFHRYLIPSLDRSHAGFYRCIVRNRVGALLQRRTEVQVAYMGSFEEGERTQAVSQGEGAVIPAPHIRCFPQPQVTWFRDGLCESVWFIFLIRRYAHSLIVFSFSHFSSVDVGGPADPIAPTIVIPPRNTSVISGTSEITMECVANARPLIKLSISWKKDGVPVRSGLSDFNRRLTVLSPVVSDSGFYECEAVLRSSSVPSVSAGAYLHVLEPPQFVKEPEKHITAEMEKVVDIPCQARGVPQPDIVWYKDAVPISPVKTPRYRVLAGGSLQVNGLLPDDTGMFQCFARNQAGEVQTNTYLAVTSEFIRPSHSPDYTFPLSAPNGIIAILFAYMSLNSVGNGAPRNILVGISHSRLGMQGLLKCFTLSMSTSGSDACPSNIIAFHVSRFVWEKDGQVIIPQSLPRLRLDVNGTLHISQTWSGDIGTYTCRVTSVGGNDSRSAHLRVRQLPHAPENPSAVLSTTEKRAINLTWAKPFDGNSPLIRYILEVSENNAPWTVLLASIEPESTAVTVNGLIPARSYQFRLCAVNDVGKGQFSKETDRVSLPEEPPSAPPQNVIASGRTNQSIMIQWQPPPESHQNGILRGYIIRYRLTGLPVDIQYKNISNPDVTNLLLEDLIIWTNYEIEVAAYNGAGLGVYSHKVTEWTLQGVPTIAPGNVKAEPFNSTTIRFTWTAPNPQFINGINQGYKVNAEGMRRNLLGPRQQQLGLEGIFVGMLFLLSVDSFERYRISWEEYNRTNTRVTHYLPNVTLEYRVTGLTAITTYTIEVAGMTSKGQGQLSSSTISSGVPPELPGPPTNLAISNIGPRSVTLQFKPGYDGKTSISRWQVEAQVGVIGENEDWVMVHQLANEPDARSLEPYMPLTNTFICMNPYIFLCFNAVPSCGPTNVSAFATTSSSILVRWFEVPKPDRNGLILGYKVVYKEKDSDAPLQFWTVEGNASHSVQLTGLGKYVLYEIQVLAFTRIGDGRPSSPSILERTLDDVPGPPVVILFPEVRTTSVRLIWQPPSQPNGIILAYQITYRLNSTNSNTATFDVLNSSARQYTVTGLRPESVYVFRIRAQTRKGWGEAAEALVVTTEKRARPQPTSRPTVPQENVQARSVQLSWEPGSDGLSPVRYYTVQVRELPEKNWTVHSASVSHESSSYIVDRLKPFTSYQFRVKATNDIGDSDYSEESEAITTLQDAPDESPTILTVTPHTTTSVLICWQPPPEEKINGILLGFQIRYRELLYDRLRSFSTHAISSPSTSWAELTSPYSIQNLSDPSLTQYELDSKKSLLAKQEQNFTSHRCSLTVPTAPPQNMVIQSATATQFDVTWDPPPLETQNGDIQGYKIFFWEYQRKNETEKLRTLFLPEGGVKLKNLTGYTTYMISVAAFNAAGDGPRSLPTRGRTQQAAPSAPSFIHFSELTTTSVNVSWGEPVFPNGILEGYRLIYEPCMPVDGVSKIVTVDVKGNAPLWLKIKDLADGVTYNFRIRAKTFTYGPEVEANITTGPGEGAPGPPGEPFISRYGSALTIHWTNGDPGRAPITRYVIEARPSDEGLWDILIKDIPKEVTSYTFNMDILKQGVSYDFRVIGVNDYGYGSPSQPSPSISAQKVAPFYEEWWFLVVVALVGLIFILLLVFILIIRGQSKKYAKKSDSSINSNCNALTHGEMVSLDESRFPALELNNRRLSVKNSFCRKNGVYTRSPPRPSPGSLHYSDEDVSAKYNDLITAESSSLTEKPSEISDSQGSDSEYEVDPNRQKTHSFVNHYISDPTYYNSWRRQQKGISRVQAYNYTESESGEPELCAPPPPLPPLPPFPPQLSSPTPQSQSQAGSLFRPKGSRTPTPSQQSSNPPSQQGTLYRPPSSLAPGSRAPIAGFSSFV